MDEEMKAMRSNNTRALNPLPAGKKVVVCRWARAVKHKSNGCVDKFKARLVAKGYIQPCGRGLNSVTSSVCC